VFEKMSENVAPSNVTTTTTTYSGKGEQQGSGTMKPTQVQQHKTTGGKSHPCLKERHEECQGCEVHEKQEGHRQEENKEDQSTIDKLKNMTIGGQGKGKDKDTGRTSEETREHETVQSGKSNVPMSEEEKHEEVCGTLRDTNEEHHVLEIVGENYSNLKINLMHQEASGVRIKSWTEETSTNIRHILCGPNALENISNQQKFLDALKGENSFSVTIPRRSEHHEKKFIPQGYALCWQFILQSHDIEFSLQETFEDKNNILHHTLIGKQMCESGIKIQGKWEVTGDTNVVLVWNNSYSKMTSKTIDVKIALVNL